MKIMMPTSVKYIIDTLMSEGFGAYIVGGCVRDSILGKNPDDWDITTSAKPSEIKRLFSKTIDTGLKHGTVTVIIDNEPYEVTTYRIDGKYEDNRRPKTVEFTRDIVEDLKRRDFTINAMAYNEEDELIDVFNGKEDLNNGLIRCVGNSKERFNEDALRMLRAIRFSAQLNFNIHGNTEEAIKQDAHLIKRISVERINVELTKLITSNQPYKFKKLYELNLLEHIMPEFIPCFNTSQNNPHHKYSVGEHILKTLEHISNISELRWTMLLHDIAKPQKKTTDEKGIDHFYGHAKKSYDIAKVILKRLKFDNRSIDIITRLILYHDYRFEPSPKAVRKALNKIGDDIFTLFLKVQEADIRAQSEYKRKEKLIKINEIEKTYNYIKAQKQCFTIKQLDITGKDIIDLGIKQGKEIGKILSYLLEAVIEKPELNKKKLLIDLVKKYIN
ncbi:MAG: CCA tRNA nucleotidyltransferase [Eubacteriales bacterium]